MSFIHTPSSPISPFTLNQSQFPLTLDLEGMSVPSRQTSVEDLRSPLSVRKVVSCSALQRSPAPEARLTEAAVLKSTEIQLLGGRKLILTDIDPISLRTFQEHLNEIDMPCLTVMECITKKDPLMSGAFNSAFKGSYCFVASEFNKGFHDFSFRNPLTREPIDQINYYLIFKDSHEADYIGHYSRDMKMEPVEISILIGMNVKTNTEVGALDSAPITEDDVYDFNQLSYLLTLSKLYEFGSEALFQDTRLSDSSQDQAIIKPSREKSEQIYTAVKDYVFKKIGGDSLYFLKAEQAMLNNIAHFLNSGDASESGSSC